MAQQTNRRTSPKQKAKPRTVNVRFEGLPDDVNALIDDARALYNVTTISKPYPNSGSDQIRVYITITK